MIYSLIPLYLFGNLHCMGMCGPLVMLLAKHPHRWLYFAGRTLSFALAAMVAAEIGLHFSSSYFSLFVGSMITVMGLALLLHLSLPKFGFTQKLSLLFSKLLLKDHPMTTFLFGFCTVFLPCGQSLIVFSACALADTAWIGFLNGALFALCTSPSLIGVMYASSFLQKWRGNYRLLMGTMTLCIGALAFLRGLADLNLIAHLKLPMHIVLY